MTCIRLKVGEIRFLVGQYDMVIKMINSQEYDFQNGSSHYYIIWWFGQNASKFLV